MRFSGGEGIAVFFLLSGAVENHAHFFECDQATVNHFVEARKDLLDMFGRLDDLQDNGQILREAENFVRVVDAGPAVARDSAQDGYTGEALLAQDLNNGFVERLAVPFVRFADVDAHQRALAFKFLVRHGGLLEAVREVDACYRQKQAGEHTRGHINGSAEPLHFFQHRGCPPAETRKRCVAAEKADGDSGAPVGRDDQAIQRELSDQAEEKAAREIDQQRAVGKRARGAKLNEPLQGVACQRAHGDQNGDQRNPHPFSNPPPRGAKIKTPGADSSQESSEPNHALGSVMANSIAFDLQSECNSQPATPQEESRPVADKPCVSEVETVAEFAGELAGITPMRAAEGVGIIEQVARVGDVLRREDQVQAFADGLAERKRKLRVARQMRRAVTIEEARAVTQIAGGPGAPGKLNVEAGIERVALVVVEKEKARRWRREIGKPSSDATGGLRELVRIRQIELRAVAKPRGAHRRFPTVNARALDGKRKEDVGIAEHVMVEVVPRVGLKIRHVERPATEGNGQAEFALFV